MEGVTKIRDYKEPKKTKSAPAKPRAKAKPKTDSGVKED